MGPILGALVQQVQVISYLPTSGVSTNLQGELADDVDMEAKHDVEPDEVEFVPEMRRVAAKCLWGLS